MGHGNIFFWFSLLLIRLKGHIDPLTQEEFKIGEHIDPLIQRQIGEQNLSKELQFTVCSLYGKA